MCSVNGSSKVDFTLLSNASLKLRAQCHGSPKLSFHQLCTQLGRFFSSILDRKRTLVASFWRCEFGCIPHTLRLYTGATVSMPEPLILSFPSHYDFLRTLPPFVGGHPDVRSSLYCHKRMRNTAVLLY